MEWLKKKARIISKKWMVSLFDDFISQIYTLTKNTKPPPGFDKLAMSRAEIYQRAYLNVQPENREKYINILNKYSNALARQK